ncbi:carboxypeptidase regulatory-like domain-containing protein [Myxococcaceae bacterium JPH2]|nr:carboxypeptidase regulatory-like domain-containing protein [Myxococcaceae bacterium JPH2]
MGLPGAFVLLRHPGRVEQVVTGEEGQFFYEPPLDGDTAIASVTKEGFRPYAPAPRQGEIHFWGSAGARVGGVTIALHPLVMFDGVVLDEQGHPVSGASVYFVATGHLNTEFAKTPKVRSDSEGKFRLPLIPDAMVEASLGDRVSRSECLEWTTQYPLTIQFEGRHESEMQRSIEGIVLDARGDPVPDVVVEAQEVIGVAMREKEDGSGSRTSPPPRMMEFRANVIGHSDELGRFMLGPLESGLYRVFVPGEDTEGSIVEDGTRDLAIRLETPGQLLGRVTVKGEGAPVESFTVMLFRDVAASQVMIGVARQERQRFHFFSAGGTYSIARLHPGTYAMTVTAPGYRDASVDDFVVSANEDQCLDFELVPASRAHGIVVDASTGTPIRGARITTREPESRGLFWQALRSETPEIDAEDAWSDADGRFSLARTSSAFRVERAGYMSWEQRMMSSEAAYRIQLSPLVGDAGVGVEFGGVGMSWQRPEDGDDRGLPVLEVQHESPAERAGVLSGDRLEAVDGTPVQSLSDGEMIALIRGDVGTPVMLRVRRGDQTLHDIVIVRGRLISQ